MKLTDYADLNMVPNEHREIWLTTIAGSLPRLVLWRAAKKRYNEIRRMLKRLNTHLSRVTADLDGLWRGRATLVRYNRLCTILESLEHGYVAAMSWLEDGQIVDGNKISNWQNPDCRAQRDLIIKQLIIFHRRCEQVIDLSTYFIEQTTADANTPPQSAFHREARLRDFINRADWTFHGALDVVNQQYNSGQLFADYAKDILDNIATEKAIYAKRRKVYPYPYPKLIVFDGDGSDILQTFRPLSAVSMLQDDEHAHWLLF